MKSRIIRTAICSAFLLLVFLLPVSAQQKNAQKVTLNVRNGTLESIIQSIMKQTSVRIVYNQELIQKAARMDFKASNEDLKPVVKRLLKGSNLTFVLQDDVMVIGPKEEQDEPKKKLGIIKGQVLDQVGKPMAVVTVNISGTPATTFTNEEGRFAITMEEGNTITLSYVGFQKKVVKPHLDETMSIKLEQEKNDMDEVVVTGYQTVNKRLSASSTYTLKPEDFKDPSATNVISMLQGKVPGLVVTKPSGSPNAVPSLRMRGTSTMIGNANPIIVVDGIIRENPNDLNPDNLLGGLDFRDQLLMKENLLARGSLTGNSISGLNVNDVESITFLKDASATALYGTRAANGVIMISTKRGKAGNMEISYNGTFGTSRRPRYSDLKVMNSQQRVRFSREMYEDGYLYQNMPIKMGYEGAFSDLMNRKISESEFQKEVADLESMNTDWFAMLFRNSFNMGHHLSLSGGSDKTSYYTSISYNNSKGAAKLDDLQEGSISTRLTSNLGSKWKLDVSLDASHRLSTGYFGVNPLDYALSTSRAISPSLVYPVSEQTILGAGPMLDFNIFNELNQTGSRVRNTNVNATANLSFLPFKSLILSSMISGGVNVQNSSQYATELSNYVANKRGYNYGSVTPGGIEEQSSPLPVGGIYFPSNMSVYSYNVRNSANYTRTVFSDNDQFNIIVGQEIRSSRNDGLDNLITGYFRDRGEGFAIQPSSVFMLNPKRTNTLRNDMSVYGTASYSYAGKYVLNGNIRTDASNRFGQYSNQRFLPVWSVSGRWNVSSEKWLENSKIINDLYLKGSYGFQGNAISSVGPDLVLSVPDASFAVDPMLNELYLNIKSLPYPDLRWEKTKSYNLEIGGSLFNSFLSFGVAVYQRRTSDAITTRYIPVEYGIQSMLVNSGNIRNEGYELDLGLNLIRSKNLKWRMTINTSKNKNMLQKGSVETPSVNTYDYLTGNVFVEGQPINTFYVFSFKGLNPKTGVPMFYGLDDSNDPAPGTFVDYLKPAGSRDPKFNGGLSTYVSYKAFSLSASFSYKIGGKRLRNPVYKPNDVYIPLPEQNVPAIFEQRWRKPGDEAFTDIPAYPKSSDINGGGYIYLKSFANMSRYEIYTYSDANLVSGSMLRCNDIGLSYSIPSQVVKRLGVKSISVSGNVSNLFVVADKKLRGQDPEIDGAGTTALPMTKTFTMGLNVNF